MTACRTLHHIANRIRSNPRLAGLAAGQLHAAADAPTALARESLFAPERGKPLPFLPRLVGLVAMPMRSRNTHGAGKDFILRRATRTWRSSRGPGGVVSGFGFRTEDGMPHGSAALQEAV